MRTMIALVLAMSIGFTATNAAAGSPPGHAPKPPPYKPPHGTQALGGGGLRLSAGALGSKYGAKQAPKPTEHSSNRKH